MTQLDGFNRPSDKIAEYLQIEGFLDEVVGPPFQCSLGCCNIAVRSDHDGFGIRLVLASLAEHLQSGVFRFHGQIRHDDVEGAVPDLLCSLTGSMDDGADVTLATQCFPHGFRMIRLVVDDQNLGMDDILKISRAHCHTEYPARMDVPADNDIPAFAPGVRAWFTGIGGCGMSGLARLAAARGVHVRGSDAVATDVTQALLDEGIAVTNGHGDLPADVDLLVHSAAVDADHVELQAARAAGIHVISYAQGLGLAQHNRLGVSIAGTHGKSTTSAILAWILLDTGLDPGFIIGAHCPQLGGGWRLGAATIPSGPHAGEGGILIAEACEFNRSFHHHRPTLGLITNVEEDHLDIYGSLEAIIEAFRVFASVLPPAEDGGSLLIAHDGAHRGVITPGLQCLVKTYGFHPEADYQVIFDQHACRVGILRDGMWVAHWTTHVPGAHMALNAAAAVILAHQLGTEWTEAAEAAERFEGLDRRMQHLGERAVADGTVTVYDDYGHHPTEIERTLRALRVAEDPNRLICVFQPHQHSRTRFLLEQFAQSFSDADDVIVPDIYFVRDSEAEQKKVSSADLVDRLLKRGVQARHVPDFDAIVDLLHTELSHGDLLVIMGAGPVWTIGRDYMASAIQPATA